MHQETCWITRFNKIIIKSLAQICTHKSNNTTIPQQINFTEKLEESNCAAMFIINENSKM